MTPLVVLVVDDDPLNRKLARDVLEAAGIETLEADRGEEAVSLVRERRPDIVLMDLRLPDMDGSEAMRRLKRDVDTSSIRVLAVTAVAGAREQLVEAGFDGYVEKPIDIDALPAEIRRHCLRVERPRSGG